MSRIGINLLYLNPKLAGGSFTYALNLLTNLSQIDKENRYVVYINKDCVDLPFNVSSNFKFRVLPFRYRNVYVRYLWEQFVLPFYVVKDKVDLLHSLGYVGPILLPGKKIVSILDINYKGHGASMGKLKKILLGNTIYLTAQTSKKIITISEFSKQQIVKYIGCKPEKIKVTLLSGMADNKESVAQKIDVRSIYKISGNYIIAFSSPSPHKNIHRLIEAFALVIKEVTDIQLVLVGYKTKGIGIQELVSNLKLEDKVVFTGFVPDEHIDPLISEANLFAFPSLYEGFGIPILDAQAEATPVVSSNAGSLPEVGGDAPLYFNPLNVNEIAESIVRILNDTNLAKEIVIKGLENRAKFSWHETAKETLSVYNAI